MQRCIRHRFIEQHAMTAIVARMNRHTISIRYFISSLFALILLAIPFPTIHNAYAHSSYELHELEVIGLAKYDYKSTTLEDYHPDQSPIIEVQQGQGFVINALVKNHNHTQEHFDFITEIFDHEGKVVYLNTRYGVAVNLGGEIPIDSARTPIILEPGAYLFKVFTWRNADDSPIALSHGGVGVVIVMP